MKTSHALWLVCIVKYHNLYSEHVDGSFFTATDRVTGSKVPILSIYLHHQNWSPAVVILLLLLLYIYLIYTPQLWLHTYP